jgi:hypothetical protein
MQVERRQHIRYRVNDDAFAIINPEPVKLVPILDIAMDGIGVYVNNEDKWLKGATKIEIMVADCSFYLENLPFEAISASKASPADSNNILDGRRCSLKFGRLTSSQRSDLKYFIRNYTQGGALWQVRQKINRLLQPFRTKKHTAPSCNTGIWQNLQRPTV